MQKQLKQLREFQTKFRSIVNDKPTLLPKEDWQLRLALSAEEHREYGDACHDEDIVEIADAIVDRIFLALGDAICHGLGDILPELFDEVVASNMSKLDNDGEPVVNGEKGVLDTTRPLGKILKSNNYFKPRIKEIIEKHYGKVDSGSR